MESPSQPSPESVAWLIKSTIWWHAMQGQLLQRLYLRCIQQDALKERKSFSYCWSLHPLCTDKVFSFAQALWATPKFLLLICLWPALRSSEGFTSLVVNDVCSREGIDAEKEEENLYLGRIISGNPNFQLPQPLKPQGGLTAQACLLVEAHHVFWAWEWMRNLPDKPVSRHVILRLTTVIFYFLLSFIGSKIQERNYLFQECLFFFFF